MQNADAWSFVIRNAGSSGDLSDAALGDITEDFSPDDTDNVIMFLDSGEIRRSQLINLPNVAPPAGATYQALMKNSTSDYDYSWQDLSDAAAGGIGIIPTGGIIAVPTNVTFAGWIDGDGVTEISRTTYAALFNVTHPTKTGATITNTSPIITDLNNTDGMVAGAQFIEHALFPPDTSISSVDSGTQITVNQNATGSTSGATIRFSNFGFGDDSTTFNVAGASLGSGLKYIIKT
jgi:hypothetical protein